MGNIDWKSFALGVLAMWLWRYLSVAFSARVG